MSSSRRSGPGVFLILLALSANLWSQCPVWLPSLGVPRRSLLLGLLPWALSPPPLPAAEGKKIVVLGGSGFIGSRICERLASAGATVVSVSRSGAPPPGAGSWATTVAWTKGDVLSMDLSSAMQGAEAVVSAIGALGSADDAAANGVTAERAMEAAAAIGAKRFVLVSATPLVKEAGIADFFPGYAEGKRRAEAALASFPGTTLLLQPTFVFGGNEFSANPPRVAEWYGEKVETLLGTDFVRAVAQSSPAALRLALLPPNSVADVAGAAAAGAVGQASGVLATHDAIKSAASWS